MPQLPPDAPAYLQIAAAIARWKQSPRSLIWLPVPTGELQRDCQCTVREVNDALQAHVAAKGKVNEVLEHRENWKAMHKYFYEFRIMVGKEQLYLEARLMHDPKLGHQVFIVSAHKG